METVKTFDLSLQEIDFALSELFRSMCYTKKKSIIAKQAQNSIIRFVRAEKETFQMFLVEFIVGQISENKYITIAERYYPKGEQNENFQQFGKNWFNVYLTVDQLYDIREAILNAPSNSVVKHENERMWNSSKYTNFCAHIDVDTKSQNVKVLYVSERTMTSFTDVGTFHHKIETVKPESVTATIF